MSDVDRYLTRPRKVLESPEGVLVDVTRAKGIGLRLLLRPLCSGSGDERADGKSRVAASSLRLSASEPAAVCMTPRELKRLRRSATRLSRGSSVVRDVWQ